MAFELAVYGLVSGLMYRMLPKKKASVYLSLLSAMILGRIAWGMAMYVFLGGNFGMEAFLAGAVTTALPGIILQLILIPVIVIALDK